MLLLLSLLHLCENLLAIVLFSAEIKPHLIFYLWHKSAASPELLRIAIHSQTKHTAHLNTEWGFTVAALCFVCYQMCSMPTNKSTFSDSPYTHSVHVWPPLPRLLHRQSSVMSLKRFGLFKLSPRVFVSNFSQGRNSLLKDFTVLTLRIFFTAVGRIFLFSVTLNKQTLLFFLQHYPLILNSVPLNLHPAATSLSQACSLHPTCFLLRAAFMDRIIISSQMENPLQKHSRASWSHWLVIGAGDPPLIISLLEPFTSQWSTL